MAKAAIIIFAVVLGAISFKFSYCQDYSESQQVEEFSGYAGTVTAVDWVASIVVINDVSFKVDSNVVITKGMDTIGFSNINIGDQVDVRYHKDLSDALVVVNMIVKI
ncbi:MAG: hypothetical protein V1933_02750 [Candidatus Omnitrophota bacterium]